MKFSAALTTHDDGRKLKAMDTIEQEAEQVTWGWFVVAHPHEAYALHPERFWQFFQTVCPAVSRQEMERLLLESSPQPPVDDPV